LGLTLQSKLMLRQKNNFAIQKYKLFKSKEVRGFIGMSLM